MRAQLIFISEQQYQDEINYSNPLGQKGAVAKAYASLIYSLYNSDNGFSPKNFKTTISKIYPTFSGYGQQDSQEFVSSLLDGLHEDLNRILKKPYIENPDSTDETVHDPEKIRELGRQYRENFRKRNESVILDLFNGWYKNTLVCPVCEKVSITFDPFSQVTLQLPVENPFQHQILFFPLRDSPFTIDVDIDKNSTAKTLKEYCAKRIESVKVENLIVVEEYNRKFYKLFEDGDMVNEIQQNDKINIYELDDAPTNWPPLDKKKAKKSSMLLTFNYGYGESTGVPNMSSTHGDKMAVPVYNRLNRQGNARLVMADLHPFFILVTREEARDPERIFRKILQKVETLTTRDMTSDSETSSTRSSEQGVTEKAAPVQNGDHKVEMKPAEGDDDFVTVSLTKGQTSATSEAAASPVRKRKDSKFLDKSYFIDPEFRTAMDVSVYTSTHDVIPSGFSTINETTKYPKLDERVKPAQRRPSTSSHASRSTSRARWDLRESESATSSEDELAQSQHSLPELSVESEEDGDTAMQESRLSPGPKPSSRHRLKQRVKGLAKSMRRSKSRSDDSRPSEDYVLKLGEGLILDWNERSWDQFFGGDSPDDFKGTRTDKTPPRLSDPELDKKRERRATRKKQGVTLDECFEETAKSEVLSEDNAWYCNRCKELRRATKTLELWTVPDILVVHLKRFGSGGRFGRDKVDVLVDFPVEGLDLNGWVGMPEDKSLVYDLFAVDNHYGGLGGGHYTANAKNFLDGQWYDYNGMLKPLSTRNKKNHVTDIIRQLRIKSQPSICCIQISLSFVLSSTHESAFGVCEATKARRGSSSL